MQAPLDAPAEKFVNVELLAIEKTGQPARLALRRMDEKRKIEGAARELLHDQIARLFIDRNAMREGQTLDERARVCVVQTLNVPRVEILKAMRRLPAVQHVEQASAQARQHKGHFSVRHRMSDLSAEIGFTA